MRSIVSFLSLLSISAGVTAQLKTEYDYILCGAGTAGLTIASRLTEQEDVTVLVVEAGINGTTAGWSYKSLPQTYVNGRVFDLPAGKVPGGSSQINGMVYSRPDAASIDDWGKVNEADWSWSTLLPFYKASESLRPPSEDQQAAGNTINEDYHGFNGPVNVSFPAVGTLEYFEVLKETAANFSIEVNRDFNGGDARGLSTYPGTYSIQGEREQRRESAWEAYYLPAVGRSNLELLDETTCLRLVWDDDSNGGDTITVRGVEVAGANNETTITARKEVIISAGVYRSPTILEFSGIGNPKILANYSIETKIELPGVGENLQDQMQGNIYYERVNSSNITFPEKVGGEITTPYLIHATYEDIFGDDAADVQDRVNSSLSDYASTISDRINNSLTSTQILNSLQIQYDAIFNTRVPAVEIFSGQALNTNTINLEFWPLIPLSRGSVHISGGNPQVAGSTPFVDVNWFMLDYDWDIFLASARWVRTFFASPPLSNEVQRESQPGFSAVSEDASDAEWKEHWNDNARAGWHGVGSCAMLPRSWGGVVDGDLKVYGTRNLRVVDASVIPFQLGGHPSATVYALAERAASLILSGKSG